MYSFISKAYGYITNEEDEPGLKIDNEDEEAERRIRERNELYLITHSAEFDHYVLIKIHPFKALDCKTITKNLVIGI